MLVCVPLTVMIASGLGYTGLWLTSAGHRQRRSSRATGARDGADRAVLAWRALGIRRRLKDSAAATDGIAASKVSRHEDQPCGRRGAPAEPCAARTVRRARQLSSLASIGEPGDDCAAAAGRRRRRGCACCKGERHVDDRSFVDIDRAAGAFALWPRCSIAAIPRVGRRAAGFGKLVTLTIVSTLAVGLSSSAPARWTPPRVASTSSISACSPVLPRRGGDLPPPEGARTTGCFPQRRLRRAASAIIPRHPVGRRRRPWSPSASGSCAFLLRCSYWPSSSVIPEAGPLGWMVGCAMEGRGVGLYASIKASMAWRICRTEVELAPSRVRRARIENQILTWLSQDAWVGVKWKWTFWRARQRSRLGLWVRRLSSRRGSPGRDSRRPPRS